MNKLRTLLAEGNKYIVVSLNLTSFIDTTAIRQIVTLFEDAKGSYICLSQCRPKVVELIKRYEADSEEFPTNIKTFISTHDAVRYLQSIRSKMTDENDTDSDEDQVEESLSSLSKPSLDNFGVTPQIRPIKCDKGSGGDLSDPYHISPRKRNSNLSNELKDISRDTNMSELDIAHEKAKKHTFSFRGTPRAQNHSYSTHTQLESDSEEHDINETGTGTGTDIEYKSSDHHSSPRHHSPNRATLDKHRSGGSKRSHSSHGHDRLNIPDHRNSNSNNKKIIPRIKWGDHKGNVTASSTDEDFDKPIDMRIVDSLTQKNISKIDEVNEDTSDTSKNKKENVSNGDTTPKES